VQDEKKKKKSFPRLLQILIQDYAKPVEGGDVKKEGGI